MVSEVDQPFTVVPIPGPRCHHVVQGRCPSRLDVCPLPGAELGGVEGLSRHNAEVGDAASTEKSLGCGG